MGEEVLALVLDEGTLYNTWNETTVLFPCLVLYSEEPHTLAGAVKKFSPYTVRSFLSE